MTHLLPLGRAAASEAWLTYKFIYRDLPASILAAGCFTTASFCATQSLAVDDWLLAIGRSCLITFLFIYCFCIPNQIAGLEEDRLNKPDRALPSGLVTVRGAFYRWAGGMAAYPFVALAVGGIRLAGWALAWQAVIIAYNFLGLDRHWFTKNVIFITGAAFLQLGAAWEVVHPLTETGLVWLVTISGVFGVTLNLQDLRDIAGDRRMGRKTLPIVWGERGARLATASSILAIPLVLHALVFGDAPAVILLVELVLGAMNVWVAWRVIWRTGPEADHRTYMLHTYWFALVLLSAAAAIPTSVR